MSKVKVRLVGNSYGGHRHGAEVAVSEETAARLIKNGHAVAVTPGSQKIAEKVAGS